MIRKLVLLSFTLGSSVIFIFQLMALQLFNSNYTERSLNNAIQKRPIYPTRGLIFDRNKNLWVGNKPVYDLMVVPENLNSFDHKKVSQVILDQANILDGNVLSNPTGYMESLTELFIK